MSVRKICFCGFLPKFSSLDVNVCVLWWCTIVPFVSSTQLDGKSCWNFRTTARARGGETMMTVKKKVVIPCSVIVFLAVYKVGMRERQRERERRKGDAMWQLCKMFVYEKLKPDQREREWERESQAEGMTWLSQWQHANTFIKWKIWKCKVSSTFCHWVDIHF